MGLSREKIPYDRDELVGPIDEKKQETCIPRMVGLVKKKNRLQKKNKWAVDEKRKKS